VHSLGLQCRLNGHRLDHPQYLRRDRGVYTGSAEAEAAGQPEHEVGPVATIGGTARWGSGVNDRQPPSATPASEHTCKQGPAAPARLLPTGTAIGVGSEQCLVPLVVRPVDVGGVMITDHHVPRLGRLAVAIGFARPPVDQFDPLLALAVDISPCVERVLQEPDDVAVTDLGPVER